MNLPCLFVRLRFLLINGCAALAVTACSAQKISLAPQLQTSDTRSLLAAIPLDQSADSAACLLFQDQRSKKTVYYKELSTEAAYQWAGEVFAYASANQMQLHDTAIIGSVYSFDLNKVYIKHLATSMSGVVVFTISSGEERYTFRGQEVRVNWFGATREFEDIIEDAFVAAVADFMANKTLVTEILTTSHCHESNQGAVTKQS